MIGSEDDESGVGEKVSLKDILYESRFFIVNLLGIIGLGWIVYDLCTGLGNRHQLFRGVQMIEAFLATADAQKGVIWWASHHRHHHKFSDTADDLHSFDFVLKET